MLALDQIPDDRCLILGAYSHSAAGVSLGYSCSYLCFMSLCTHELFWSRNFYQKWAPWCSWVLVGLAFKPAALLPFPWCCFLPWIAVSLPCFCWPCTVFSHPTYLCNIIAGILLQGFLSEEDCPLKCPHSLWLGFKVYRLDEPSSDLYVDKL